MLGGRSGGFVDDNENIGEQGGMLTNLRVVRSAAGGVAKEQEVSLVVGLGRKRRRSFCCGAARCGRLPRTKALAAVVMAGVFRDDRKQPSCFYSDGVVGTVGERHQDEDTDCRRWTTVELPEKEVLCGDWRKNRRRGRVTTKTC